MTVTIQNTTRMAIVGAGNVGATFAHTLLLSGLAAEIVRAEHHLAASDLAALARIAHSMKSALRMLGQQRLAQDASLVEQRCAQRADAGAALAWARLRAGLQGWMARPGDAAEPA